MKKSFVAFVIVCLSVLTLAVGCTDDNDIAHDDDGFLGYSDSFWDWYADNN